MSRFTLHTDGPWAEGAPPLVYDTREGKHMFETARTEDQGREADIEKESWQAIYLIVKGAIDDSLPALSDNLKEEIMEAAFTSLIAKTNFMQFNDEGDKAVTSLKLDTPAGTGLEIREDHTIHYWDGGRHIQEITSELQAQIGVIILEVYNAVQGISPASLAIKLGKAILKNRIDQLGIEIIPEVSPRE